MTESQDLYFGARYSGIVRPPQLGQRSEMRRITAKLERELAEKERIFIEAVSEDREYSHPKQSLGSYFSRAFNFKNLYPFLGALRLTFDFFNNRVYIFMPAEIIIKDSCAFFA